MKTFKFLLMSFALLFFIACKKNGDNEPMPELVVSTENVTLSNAGETKAFHVKSNMGWSLSSSENWVSFSVNNGQSGTSKVEITVTQNPNVTDRNAVITIVSGSLTKTIAVTQSASSLFKVEKNEYNINQTEQELVIKVESNQTYTIEVDKEWLSRKANPVVSGNNYTETFTIKRNGNIFNRTAIITLKKGNETQLVNVIQAANPLNITANNTGVSLEAVALVAKMNLGWNLGNSLEATSTTTASETLWGNVKTTKALIDGVKKAGFNAVRIPCAWSAYIEDQTTYKIKDSWLERVKEVVDYCVDNDMYAIINIHWDGGWLEENPKYASQVEVNKKQKALWEQIAVFFRDYDEHLLFAGTNEVHADYNTPTTEHTTVQNSFNQTFVTAVRSTGGRNAYRNLIVQGYNTNITHTYNSLIIPEDNVAKRLITEVHFYDPYDFSLDTESNKYLWGKEFVGSANVSTWGQEAWVDSEFAKMKTKFIDKGIPVILGEYGAMLRNVGTNQDKHVKARNYYLSYVTNAAKSIGMVPFYWDAGFTGTNGSGLFNRATGEVVYQDAVNAIVNATK